MRVPSSYKELAAQQGSAQDAEDQNPAEGKLDRAGGSLERVLGLAHRNTNKFTRKASVADAMVTQNA